MIEHLSDWHLLLLANNVLHHIQLATPACIIMHYASQHDAVQAEQHTHAKVTC
jgi:hypothetical protein